MARIKSFDTGIDLGPWFTEQLINTFTPKSVLKQSAEQQALARLAQLQPMISKLSDEDQKRFYNQFYQAFGTYQPQSLIRRALGAGEEPLLPLPEGTKEERQYVKGPLGIGGGFQKQYTFPTRKPLSFDEPALLSPVHEAELRKSAAAMGMSPESIEDYIGDIRAKKVSLWSSLNKQLENLNVGRGTRWTQDYMQKTPGATLPQAIEALKIAKPELGGPFAEHVSTLETNKALKEATTAATTDRVTIAQQEADRKAWEGKERIRQTDLKIAQQKEQMANRERNRLIAGKATNEINLMKAMNSAYAIYQRGVIAHNIMEQKKVAESKFSDQPYIPFIKDALDQQTWLQTEGSPFYEKMLEMQGGVKEGPLAPPPIRGQSPAAQEIDKQFFQHRMR